MIMASALVKAGFHVTRRRLSCGTRAELGAVEPAPRAARALGGQRRAAAGGQRPAPAVDRHPGHPEALGHLPVGGALLDPFRGFQPHLFPPGALLGGQPTTLGVPYGSGIARAAPTVSRL